MRKISIVRSPLTQWCMHTSLSQFERGCKIAGSISNNRRTQQNSPSPTTQSPKYTTIPNLLFSASQFLSRPRQFLLSLSVFHHFGLTFFVPFSLPYRSLFISVSFKGTIFKFPSSSFQPHSIKIQPFALVFSLYSLFAFKWCCFIHFSLSPS